MDPNTYEQIKKFYELEKILFTKRELDDYVSVCIREQDERGRIKCAVNKAVAKGMEKEKVETAKKGILKGLDNQTIIDLTGLPIETIEKLRTEI